MEGMIKVNEDVIQNVSGGVQTQESQTRTIVAPWAGLYAGPGTGFDQVTTLYRGTPVVLTGESEYNGNDESTFYEITSPLYGWIMKSDLQ